MQINYADEVIDLLTLLEIDKQTILDKDNDKFAEWLKTKEECIETFLMGKYRDYTYEGEHLDFSFSDIVVEIKNKLLESKE